MISLINAIEKHEEMVYEMKIGFYLHRTVQARATDWW